MPADTYISAIDTEEKLAFDRYWKTFGFKTRSDFVRTACRKLMESTVTTENLTLEALNHARKDSAALRNIMQVLMAMQIAHMKTVLASSPAISFQTQEEKELFERGVEERFWNNIIPLVKDELSKDKTLDFMVIERERELGIGHQE